MPLLGIDISVLEIRQRCVACGATNRIPMDKLALGAGAPGRVNPNAIVLPRCPQCHAQETLIRNWDRTPTEFHGTAHCEQRAAVNALGQYLKTNGYQAAEAKATHAAENTDPPELLELADAASLLLVPGVPGCEEWNLGVLSARDEKRLRVTF